MPPPPSSAFPCFQILIVAVGSGLDVVSFQLLPILTHLDFWNHQPMISKLVDVNISMLSVWSWEALREQFSPPLPVMASRAKCTCRFQRLSPCAYSQFEDYHIVHTRNPITITTALQTCATEAPSYRRVLVDRILHTPDSQSKLKIAGCQQLSLATNGK